MREPREFHIFPVAIAAVPGGFAGSAPAVSAWCVPLLRNALQLRFKMLAGFLSHDLIPYHSMEHLHAMCGCQSRSAMRHGRGDTSDAALVSHSRGNMRVVQEHRTRRMRRVRGMAAMVWTYRAQRQREILLWASRPEGSRSGVRLPVLDEPTAERVHGSTIRVLVRAVSGHH